jgi:hypothetical protein
MVHFTYFRPFHQYLSYYPYYLPSYYSRYYPGRYHRYFQPTKYWLEKRHPVLEIETKKSQNNKMAGNLMKLVLIVSLLFVIFRALKN